MIAVEVLLSGFVAGLVHLVAIVVLYGNPLVARIHAANGGTGAATGAKPSRPRHMATQFLGTQIEVYLMTVGFVWLHPLLPLNGLAAALLLAALFAALRVYPSVWALWLQGTHTDGYLAVEAVAGVLGTVVVVLTLYLLM